MQTLIKECKKQINDLTMNKETIKRLNGFFYAVNKYLKGSNDSLIIIFVDSLGALRSNILSDNIDIITPMTFKKLFIEWINGFNDCQELLFDILTILNDHGLFELNHGLRLHLFKVLFNSGYFCYTPLDSQDFKDNYDYIEWDLRILANIVSNDSLDSISQEITTVLKELYLFDRDIDLKELII